MLKTWLGVLFTLLTILLFCFFKVALQFPNLWKPKPKQVNQTQFRCGNYDDGDYVYYHPEDTLFPKGKEIFNAHCAACHSMVRKVTGPALKGVLERRDRKWVERFIRNSQEMIKSGDTAAVKLFNDYNQTVMTAQHLDDKQMNDLLHYLEKAKYRP